MFDQLKRLGTDTAIYGVSTIVGRFLTFLLTPLYANILAPWELGVVATLYAYIAFLNVVYGYGMESAYFRYASSLEMGSRNENFLTPWLSHCITSLVFSGIIILGADSVAGLIGLSAEEHRLTIMYAGCILFLDAVAIVPFAALRLERKAIRFAVIKLINIVSNVVCNLIALLILDLGVEGIFLSGVVSSGLTLIMLLPTIRRHLPARVLPPLYRALLKFGLPYVPAGIATMMIQVVDRPILEALTDKATVGIYQANYRLGIFMMLVVSMVDFAWRPFFMTQAREPNAKAMFARVLTYVVLLMAGVFLVVTFFLEEIVKTPVLFGRSLLPEPYWPGLSIVPIVLLAYMCLGVSNIMVAGIYIQKKTTYLPPIAFLGAGVNVGANFLLIPAMGIMGAALATLLSYASMAVAVYVASRHVFPIQYEVGRVAKVLVAAGTVYAVLQLFGGEVQGMLFKIGLLGVFILLMYMLRFLNASEMRRLGLVFTRPSSGEPPPEDLPVQ